MFQRVSNGFWVGFFLGLAIVFALVATQTRVHDSSKDASSPSLATPEAARAFVDDWQHMRTSTWMVDSTFKRVLADGRSYSGDIHEAQSPPKHVRVAFGTKTLDVPGKTYSCAASSEQGAGTCRAVEATETYDQSAGKELQNVRAAVLGSTASYSVVQTSKQCFRIQSPVASDVSSWGQEAIFCFDLDTGSLMRSEIRRGDVIDTTKATSTTSRVPESEFKEPTA